MDELFSQIQKLAQEEVEQALTKHPASFSSAYEAYAVLLEEVEEAQEMMEQVNWHLNFIWEEIKHSFYPEPVVSVKDVEKYTLHLATQALLILTACEKFSRLMEGEQT